MLHFPSVSIRRSWPGRGTMVNDVNVPSRRKVSPPAFTIPLYCSTGTPQLPINSFAASESGGGAADNRDATKMVAKNVRIARVFMRDLTRISSAAADGAELCCRISLLKLSFEIIRVVKRLAAAVG